MTVNKILCFFSANIQSAIISCNSWPSNDDLCWRNIAKKNRQDKPLHSRLAMSSWDLSVCVRALARIRFCCYRRKKIADEDEKRERKRKRKKEGWWRQWKKTSSYTMRRLVCLSELVKSLWHKQDWPSSSSACRIKDKKANLTLTKFHVSVMKWRCRDGCCMNRNRKSNDHSIQGSMSIKK